MKVQIHSDALEKDILNVNRDAERADLSAPTWKLD